MRDGKIRYEQKQVDILMATDMVLPSAKHQVDELVAVTGDSDFLPAVRIARDEGVIVRLVHGLGRHKPQNELWDTSDERLPLTPEWLTACLRPTLPPMD